MPRSISAQRATLFALVTLIAPSPEVSAQPWQDMNYGPYLTTTIEVDQQNMAYKAVAIRLDEGPGGVSKGHVFVAFDTDTLRFAAGWTGPGPIDWKSVVFDGSHNTHPSLVGQRMFINPEGPGWAAPSSASFDAARVTGVDGRKYGPIDRTWAHWRGLYLYGQQVILSYSVGDVAILEMPAVEGRLDRPFIARTMNIGPRKHDLILQVAGHSRRRAVEQTVEVDKTTHRLAMLIPDEAGERAQNGVTEEGFRFNGRQHFRAKRPEDFRMTGADFTITAQIKTRDGGTIFSKAAEGDWVPDGKTLFVRGGRLCYDIGWVGVVQSQRRVDDDRWHHVAMTYEAATGTVRLYIDGQLDTQRPLQPQADVKNHQVRIGYTSTNFPQDGGFVGHMRRVQFFPRALTADELTGRPAPLGALADWELTTDSKSTFADATGSGHEAALLGGPAAAREAEGVAIAVVGDPEMLEWITTNSGLVRLRIVAGQRPLRIKLLYAALPRDLQCGRLVSHLATTKSPEDLAPMTRGGPARWPQPLPAEITTTSSTDSPFEVDVLETPDANPWKSWMRLGGFDFFADGNRAAVCTWQGDVWFVDGLKQPSSRLQWRRVATGLFQPLGLKIVDEQVYVRGRDQITRIHDVNGDGEADFYENFNNDTQVTDHFHEFAMDLQTDSAGNFYYAKGARHALDALVPQHGTLNQVTSDGKESRILARGFRAPNGVLVNDDGTFIVSDQEGHWTPMNRINWVRPGGYYGNMMAFNPDGLAADETEPPVVWIHREVDRSPAAQVWVPQNTWGSLGGALLSLSYGTGRIYRILYQDTGAALQGGIVELPALDFPTGIQRGRFRGDWLYVCGLFGWSSDKTKAGGFYRVRATDVPLGIPQELQITRDGVLLQFPRPLDKSSATDSRNYVVSRWNYRRTANYGSEDYRVSDGKPGRDAVSVASVSTSADGRSVFLHIPDMQTCMQMRVRYRVPSSRGPVAAGLLDTTIRDLPPTALAVRDRFGDRWGLEEKVAREGDGPSNVQPGLMLRIVSLTRQENTSVRVSRLAAYENSPGQRPDVLLEPGPFEAVWEGFLSLDLADQAQFQCETVGQMELELNGQRVSWRGEQAAAALSEPLALRAGLNRLRLSLKSREDGEARLRLYWKTHQRVLEPLDPAALVHDPSSSIALADTRLQRRGRELFATLNCGRCHATPLQAGLDAAMPELARDSPSLSGAADRFTSRWVHAWINQPHALRNGLSMPQVFAGSAGTTDVADLVAYIATLHEARIPGGPSSDGATDVDQSGRDSLIDRGLLLYEDLGCIGCHHFGSPDANDPHDRISLRFVGAKYQDGYLYQFLLRPHEHYRWRKMPDFQLEPVEALALSVFLRDNSSPLPDNEFLSGNADRGRLAFTDRGCAACHVVDERPLQLEDQLRPLFAACAAEPRLFGSRRYSAWDGAAFRFCRWRTGSAGRLSADRRWFAKSSPYR